MARPARLRRRRRGFPRECAAVREPSHQGEVGRAQGVTAFDEATAASSWLAPGVVLLMHQQARANSRSCPLGERLVAPWTKLPTGRKDPALTSGAAGQLHQVDRLVHHGVGPLRIALEDQGRRDVPEDHRLVLLLARTKALRGPLERFQGGPRGSRRWRWQAPINPPSCSRAKTSAMGSSAAAFDKWTSARSRASLALRSAPSSACASAAKASLGEGKDVADVCRELRFPSRLTTGRPSRAAPMSRA
jgi:hypothetical protein